MANISFDRTLIENDILIRQYWEYEEGISDINVKHRIKNAREFWKYMGANDFILDLIDNGYKVPFLSTPPGVFLRNNASARQNGTFVESAINDLSAKRLVK